MEIRVKSASELIVAIEKANHLPDEPHTIWLDGADEDYVLGTAAAQYFGPTAFPVVVSDITIHGNGRIILRSINAPPFRFFALNASSSNRPNARLTLNQLTLCNGDSGTMGGGAIVADGLLTLNNCILRENWGTRGGALYAGFAYPAAINQCLFIHNVAREQGAAIAGAHSSHLVVQDSLFYENYVKESSLSIYTEGTWDQGYRTETLDIPPHMDFPNNPKVEFYTTEKGDSTVSVNFELLQTAKQQTGIINELKYKSGHRKPYPRYQTFWWDDYVIKPDTQKLLNSLLEQEAVISKSLIEQMVFAEQLPALLELAIAFQASQIKLESQASRMGSSFKHIYHYLLSTPGLPSLEAASDLLIYYRAPDYEVIPGLIVQHQPPEIIAEFFEKHGDAITAAADNPNDIAADNRVQILLRVVQGLVIQGVDCEGIPAIKRFVEGQRARRAQLHYPFVWLPLRLLPIEHEARNHLPTYSIWGRGGGASFYWEGRTPLEQLPELPDLPVIKNISSDLEPHRFSALAQFGGHLEVFICEFETPLTDAHLQAKLLTKFDLKCMEGATAIRWQSESPDHVFNTLLSIAATGARYSGGIYGQSLGIGFGRLLAWGDLAVLLGMDVFSPKEDLDAGARSCKWFGFTSNSKWFAGKDIGIAALRPDGRTLVIAAASASD